MYTKLPARRPHVIAAAAALGTALTLASCVGGSGDPDSESAEQDGPVTLTWWDTRAPGEAADATDAVLERYEEENPDVTIDRQFIAYADIKQRLLQSAGADSLPDLVVINSPDHQQFAELGIAVDLTDRLEEWGELDRYPEGVIDSASFDGSIYGLPMTTNCLALFYNTEWFDEEGVEPPTTWEEFEEVAATMTTSDRYGLAYSAVSNQQAVFQWLPTLWQASGDLTELAGPESQNALEFWGGFMDSGSVSREALNWDQSDVAAEFGQERAAMMINGPWQLPYLAEEAPDLDYGVALMPAGEEEASVLGGENYMVIDGPEQDAASDLLLWLQEPEQIATVAEGTGSLPTRDDVEAFTDDPSIAVFTEQLQVSRPRAYGANYAEIADEVVQAIQSNLAGDTTADEALADAAQAVDPLLP